MDFDASHRVMLRIGALIVACTLLLTINFVGIIAALSGDITGLDTRIPWYLLVAAIIFVATIVLLESSGTDGKTIIVSALFTGVSAFVLILFGGEGVLYTLDEPETVLDPQLTLYFFTAALVATGLGYWGLRHWREFTRDGTATL